MSLRGLLLVSISLLAASGAGWLFFERHLSGTWFAFGVHPEVTALVDASLADQKSLAALDPAAADAYRLRFDEIETLRGRLRILEHNRRAIVRRFETLLFVGFGLVLAGAGAAYAGRELRDRRRLARLGGALADLCAGRVDLRIDDRGRDAVGRVARMIEDTSRVMARDRRRLQALENLSAWQEAARRHAHEMRTPLTAARLELARLEKVASGLASGQVELGEVAGSLGQELERLAAFTRRFTSFARLPRPRPVPTALAELAAEFAAGFGGAWPGLSIAVEGPAGGGEPAGHGAGLADVDRDMLRQVLVNLCDNSAHAAAQAGAGGGGRVTLRQVAGEGWVGLEVADDGPGLPAEIQRRLFEPYATTRKVGEGMGLGLAIARKILLDHGGDLELVSTSPAGTAFRLTLPRAASAGGAR